MQESGIKNPAATLSSYGINGVSKANWNLSEEALIDTTVAHQLGHLTDTGALSIVTGEFTGRSPKDKFIVKDKTTADSVFWGEVNIPFDEARFEALYQKVTTYLTGKELYIKDAAACADPEYRLQVRVIS